MQKYCRIVTSIYEKSEELWELVKYGRNDEEDDLFFITSYYGYMYIFLSVFYLCLPLVGVTPVHALGFLGLKREFGEIKGTFRRPALVRKILNSIIVCDCQYLSTHKKQHKATYVCVTALPTYVSVRQPMYVSALPEVLAWNPAGTNQYLEIMLINHNWFMIIRQAFRKPLEMLTVFLHQ